MIDTLTFVTGNKAKAEQLSRHLDMRVEHQKIDLDEIQSLDLLEIIEHKAKEAYSIIRNPVLVEDCSLKFCAMGKLPGPLIKWFFTELKNEGLCRLMDHYAERSAVAEVAFGLYDGEKFETFTGEIMGKIADRPQGSAGFGWDPIFIPDGHDKTWAEMDREEQIKTSMRRIALKKLEDYLKGKGQPQ